MPARSQISLPEAQVRWLADRARSRGYSSPEDYLSDLVSRDQALNGPHEAPSGPERKRIAAELERLTREIAEGFRGVPEDELEREIDQACEDVRRRS